MDEILSTNVIRTKSTRSQYKGEMEDLIRNYSWSNSLLGKQDAWPLVLKNTLDLILHSGFPMLLLWGEELLVVYNDPYRQILGNDGKHPSILGKKAKEAWPESWAIIEPLLSKVMNEGETCSFENMEVPFTRNGRVEKAYWTFSYSPVSDDGKVVGVLVVCQETTSSVFYSLEQQRLTESIISASPTLTYVYDLLKDENVFASPQIAEILGYTAQEVQSMKSTFLPMSIDKEDALTIEANLKKLFADRNGEIFEVEYRIKRKDGEVVWLSDRSRVFGRDLDGKPTQILGVATDITTRKRLEERLAQQYEELQMLYNTAPVGLCLLDEQYRYTRINKRLAEINGVPVEEHIGRTIYEVIPELAPTIESLLQDIFEKGEPLMNLEIKGYTKAHPGVERIWNENWYPIKDENGKTTGVSIVAEEVTEQRRAQQALSELANAMPQLVWIANPDGVVTFYNDQVGKYDGAYQNEKGNWVWNGLIHPDELDRTRERWAAAIASREMYSMEHRIKLKDGGYRWHLSRAYAQKDEEGRVIKWFGTATNIHEQKTLTEELEKIVTERTEELLSLNKVLSRKNVELSHARRFLQTVLDSSVEVVVSFDKDLNYRFVNRQAERFMKKSAKELIGKNLLEVFPQVKGTELYTNMVQALQGEMVHIKQRQSLSHQDKILESYFIPYTNGREVEGVITMQRDITPFVNLSEELRKSNEELLRSNSDLQQFAHVTSHDLKEPVRKIKLYTDLIQSKHDDELSEGLKKYFNKLANATNRISSMIDGILQYSSVDAIEQSFEPIDLNELIRNVQEDLELIILTTNAQINANTLPIINGSRILIYQLFYNLINNSLKFIDSKRPPVIRVVEVGTTLDPKLLKPFVQIDIIDNGIGFEHKFEDKIFESFMRLHPKDKFEGTGLGLALCRRIVARHGGQISAKGKLNEGATFSVFLPE